MAWVYESELDFSFADLQGEAYRALNLDAETDDATDEAINAELESRELRQMRGMEWKFDAGASREDYYDAVLTGMRNWKETLQEAE